MWLLSASSSALLSAAAAIVQKKILFRLNALEFSFLVSAIILIFSSFVPLTVDVTSIPISTILIIIGKSLLGGCAFLLVMMSLKHNQISNALPLLGLTPGVTAVVALLLLGDSLQGWEWAGLGLMTLGTFILEVQSPRWSLRSLKTSLLTKSHYYIFGALALFAVSSVADKLLVSNYKISPLVVLFYQHLVYCFVFASLLLLQKCSLREVISKGKEPFQLIVAVAVLTIAYRFAQLEATKDAPVALVLAVKRTSILYASFLGGKIFAEEQLVRRLAGATLIVVAGFFILRFLA
jgi:drug/metabolite transporter (DMT)-like permease